MSHSHTVVWCSIVSSFLPSSSPGHTCANNIYTDQVCSLVKLEQISLFIFGVFWTPQHFNNLGSHCTHPVVVFVVVVVGRENIKKHVMGEDEEGRVSVSVRARERGKHVVQYGESVARA